MIARSVASLVHGIVDGNYASLYECWQVLEQSKNAATILQCAMAGEKQRLLRALLSRIQLQEGAIEISIDPPALLKFSGL